MAYTPYAEKLKDPRWQKKRLQILERDNFSCTYCLNDKDTLHVHHTCYEKGIEPWEAKDEFLTTLCDNCHEYFHERIPQYHKEIAEQLRIKLKDPFITACAFDLCRDVSKLHDLIYLLWEFKDSEDLIIDTLTEMFQKDLHVPGWENRKAKNQLSNG